MQISQKEIKDVTILSLSGNIAMVTDDVQLRQAVSDALNKGARKLLISLANVRSVDSSGIGALVSAYTSVSGRGGKLRLCNLPASVKNVLEVTQLNTVFETFDTEEAALASF